MTATDELAAIHEMILREPDEDTHRLVYADRLDERGENGDAERAEFIRVQCWLWANPSCSGCTGSEWLNGKPCQECDKRYLYRNTANEALAGDCGRNWRHWVGPAIKVVPPGAFYYDHLEFSRGMVGKITCSAVDWLQHADALAWHPTQTVACKGCNGRGYNRRTDIPGVYNDDHVIQCEQCTGPHGNGTGRIPRPCPPAAHPIREVTLITEPDLNVVGSINPGTIDTRVYVSLPGKAARLLRGDDEEWRDVAAKLLAIEWPGITFTLPPS